MKTVVVALLLLAGPAHAIVNGYETKLEAVAALGLIGQEHHCTATLVAPAVALTARHCWGVVGWTGDFEARFVGGQTAHVIAWHVSSTDDVALVYFAGPVEGVLPMPVLLAEPQKPAGLILAGWGMQGPGLNEGPSDQLLACDTELRQGSGVAFRSAWDSSGPGCGPNTRDSGGPALLYYRSRLVIVGAIVGPTSATPLWNVSSDPAFAALQAGDF